jgi:hypothetical protein
MHIKQLARDTAVECDDMAFLLSVTNVSVQAVDIVNNLPKLKFD